MSQKIEFAKDFITKLDLVKKLVLLLVLFRYDNLQGCCFPCSHFQVHVFLKKMKKKGRIISEKQYGEALFQIQKIAKKAEKLSVQNEKKKKNESKKELKKKTVSFAET